MGGDDKAGSGDAEVLLDVSKREVGNPQQNFKKFFRKLKSEYRVSVNKDIINSDKLALANLVIFAGPREMFSSEEFAAMKDFMAGGGNVLFMLGEGGEGKHNTNVNYLIEACARRRLADGNDGGQRKAHINLEQQFEKQKLLSEEYHVAKETERRKMPTGREHMDLACAGGQGDGGRHCVDCLDENRDQGFARTWSTTFSQRGTMAFAPIGT